MNVVYKTIDSINQEFKKVATSTRGWNRKVVRDILKSCDLVLTKNEAAFVTLREMGFDHVKLVDCSDKEKIPTKYNEGYFENLIKNVTPDFWEHPNTDGFVPDELWLVGEEKSINEFCKGCSWKATCNIFYCALKAQ